MSWLDSIGGIEEYEDVALDAALVADLELGAELVSLLVEHRSRDDRSVGGRAHHLKGKREVFDRLVEAEAPVVEPLRERGPVFGAEPGRGRGEGAEDRERENPFHRIPPERRFT